MLKDILLKVLLTGAGAAIVTGLFLRLVPNEKLDAWFFAWGRALSSLGRHKWGKAFWEPIETFLENTILICVRAFIRGLDADDEDGMTPPPLR